MAWLAVRGGCYGPERGVRAGGVAGAVGTVWVVALGAGMLEQLWVWGGSWGCGMGVFQGTWVRGGLSQRPGVAWGDGGAEP